MLHCALHNCAHSLCLFLSLSFSLAGRHVHCSHFSAVTCSSISRRRKRRRKRRRLRRQRRIAYYLKKAVARDGQMGSWGGGGEGGGVGGDGRQPHATRSASSLLPQSVRACICEVDLRVSTVTYSGSERRLLLAKKRSIYSLLGI